jgi:hypothetical protein
MLFQVFHVSEAEPGDAMLYHGRVRTVLTTVRLSRRCWLVTFDDGSSAGVQTEVHLQIPDAAAREHSQPACESDATHPIPLRS